MWNFMIGFFCGGALGVFAMAMCFAAKYSDEHAEDFWED